MRFSIIVPVYNVEQYLRKCLDSVANQIDFDDYEVIVVNDGSTDNSELIINGYRNNSKFKIIEQANKGLGSARNTGLSIASGEYLLFIDSDDYIDSNSLRIIDKYITNYACDILIFGINLVEENNTRAATWSTYDERMNQNLSKHELILLCPSACNKAIKKSLFDDNNLIFPEGVKYEDSAITRKLIIKSEKTLCCNKFLYNYVQRQSSIMHSGLDFDSMRFVCDDLYNYFKTTGILKDYYDEIEAIITRNMLEFSDEFPGDSYSTSSINRAKAYLNKLLPNCIDNKYLNAEEKDSLIFLLSNNRVRRLKRIIKTYIKKHFPENIIRTYKRLKSHINYD